MNSGLLISAFLGGIFVGIMLGAVYSLCAVAADADRREEEMLYNVHAELQRMRWRDIENEMDKIEKRDILS